MPIDSPLFISQQILSVLGTRMFTYHGDRLPSAGAVLIVSNHRSFMDAPLLMMALNRPIRFACHHYMGQVPVLRDFVTGFGCFPLAEPQQRQQTFFHQASEILNARQVVGIFPEGAQPMVYQTPPSEMQSFQRGFAHLALRARIHDLVVLPVAIASDEEDINSIFPLQLLRVFDPSEPLFNQTGWHPMVVYHRVNVLIGRPQWITEGHRRAYFGKQGKAVVHDLTAYCQQEIAALLTHGC